MQIIDIRAGKDTSEMLANVDSRSIQVLAVRSPHVTRRLQKILARCRLGGRPVDLVRNAHVLLCVRKLEEALSSTHSLREVMR